MLMLGEVSTGLLRNSISVPPRVADDILMLRRDQPVRASSRPIGYAVSQDLLTGVDCRLSTGAESGPRCIGTVRSHAAMTGGRVLQGSAYVTVAQSRHNRRLPWSYYLSLPGTVEVIGTARLPDVAAGFAATANNGGLDLGSIGARVMNEVHQSRSLDGRVPFKMARTTLRWIVAPTLLPLGDGPPVQFTVDEGNRRTVLLRLDLEPSDGTAERLVELCEDLALHDWLLTALETLIERSQIGSGSPEQIVDRLKPAIDQLLHLWMPAARTDPALGELWQSLERRPGFTLQWRAGVDRVRDQLAASNIAMLSAAIREAGRR
jgi:hypothetical protein